MFSSFFRFYYRRELGNLVNERRRLAELTEMFERRLFEGVQVEAAGHGEPVPDAVAPAVKVERHLSKREQDEKLFSFSDEQRRRLYEIMVGDGHDHIPMECVDLGLSEEGNEEFVRKLLERLQWFQSPDGFNQMHDQGDTGGSVASEVIAEILDAAVEAGWSPLEIIWRAMSRYTTGPGLRDARLRPLREYILDTLKIADEAAAERKATAPIKNGG
jgi:hypothetical protein